jgi:type VI secretion system VgrG family protein
MPKYMPEKRFSFISNSSTLNQETFGVVQFSGVEGISLPYEFEIMLVSDTTDIDLDEVMAYPAKFTIHRKNGDDVDFHGILNSFEQLHKYNEYVFYRAHLVPRLWWLSITHHNQVCLNKSVPDIIALALKDSGLTKLDFEFKTRNTYQPIEYVCQYNESHFNFISRWLEREGLYYYFDQKGPAEKIIFTDTNIAHTNLPDVSYAPPEGLLEDENVEIINSFTCRQRQLPQKIFLKDYNYQRPSLGISGSADVDSRGRGTDYIYGEYFGTSEEGDRLAGIRAEVLNCRRREFIGESTIPFIEPGYTFTLSNHYRESFNQQYLVESISHEGNQMGYLLPSIAEGVPEYKHTIYYRNSFTVIPSDIQFRAEKKANRPYISGALHAKVDAEGTGKYAELDDQGRYKVRLPFDESDDHRSGKASTWLRMMQPYANQMGGMQFPLTKGTEVLLTFIDGDPDRPVIAGAIANPETPSPVSAKNQTESVIQTGGNNKIRMEDLEGKERIIMESPTANSWVRIGAPNDPPSPFVVETGNNANSFIDSTGTWNLIKVDNVNSISIDTNIAANSGKTLTYKVNKTFQIEYAESKYKIGSNDLGSTLTQNANYTIDSNTWLLEDVPVAGSNQSLNFSRIKNVVLKIISPKVYGDESNNDGIRIYTDNSLWLESSKGQYGEYRVGLRADGPRKNGPDNPPKTGDLLTHFGSDYNPTGMKNRFNGTAQTLDDVLKNAHVRVSSLDTINTQEGNIYDFGGYWIYNLGNSYVENHINQKNAKLNDKHDNDMAVKGGPNSDIKCFNISTNSADSMAVDISGYLPDSIEDFVGDLHNALGLTPGKTLDANKTRVIKTFGGAEYKFTNGLSNLNVEVGTAEETHFHGKSTYEYKYTNGKIIQKTFSKSGHSEEWKYDRITGAILNHDKTDWLGVGGVVLATSLSMSEKQTIGMNLAALQSFNLFIGEKANINVSASANIDIDLSASLFFKIKAGLGLGIEIEGKPLKWSLNNSSGHFRLHGPGTKVEKEAAFKAKVDSIILDTLKTQISSNDVKLVNSKIRLEARKLGVKEGYDFHL